MRSLRSFGETILGVIARFWVAVYGSRRAVVLAYHSVSKSTWIHAIDPDEFRRQMAWLSKYADVVPLSEIERIIANGSAPRRRPCVAITFDDGYQDWISNVMPVLQTCKLPATFFVTTSFKLVTSQPQEGLEPLLSEQVALLARAGFEIGGHGHTHRDLSVCSNEELNVELTESRRILKELTGQAVTHMSYPKGRFAASRRAALKSSGFTFSFAGHGSVGKGTDPYSVPRIPAPKPVSLTRLKARIFRTLAWGF